jgi:hypothetical protein
LVRGVPYGTQYPQELRDILVGNGTLNADYTPNESTAARLGWRLVDAADVPVSERDWLDSAERQRLLESSAESTRQQPTRVAPQLNAASRGGRER